MVTGPLKMLNDGLQGRQCKVTKRDFDWNFNFGEELNIVATSPWRIVTPAGIAHGSEDDGQQFGLAQPVNGESTANDLLSGRDVRRIELDELTGDLNIVFQGDTRLDFFNSSSGYEGWQASLSPNLGISIVALGGGKLAVW